MKNRLKCDLHTLCILGINLINVISHCKGIGIVEVLATEIPSPLSNGDYLIFYLLYAKRAEEFCFDSENNISDIINYLVGK